MLSPVESLPVELFDMISAEFSIPECQSVRLTSRQLHRLVHQSFVRLAFSEQSTTLSPSSLDRLTNVSSHRGFRDAVRCLHIRLLNHHEYANLNAISRVGRFPPPKRFPRISGVRDKNISDEATTYAYVMQNERPARLYDGLLKAIKGLRQLRTIRFSMKPPASSRLESEETSHHLFRTRCFEAVVYCITHSNIKLEEFSMGRRKGRKILYKQSDSSPLAFQLTPASLQALRRCFSNLQSLSLCILTDYNAPRPASWVKDIRDFIAAAPKLKKLTLSLDGVGVDPRSRSSQYSCAIVKSLATSCRLPDLETLEIIDCSPHGKDLIDLIQAHSSSLQCIVFSHVRLLTSKWRSTGDALKTCQRLRYFRLVACEDPWTNLPVISRIQDQPQMTWDVRKNSHSVFDWLHRLIAVDGLEDGAVNVSATPNSIHSGETNVGSQSD